VSKIQAKLQDVLREIYDLEKVKRHADAAEIELRNAYNELRRLEKEVDKEYKDVEELENLSIKKLFHKILGSKEEQLEKERQEYLQAVLKLKDYKKKVELIEYENDLISGKTGDLPALQKKLNNLKERRLYELVRSSAPEGKIVSKLLKKQDEFLIRAKSIDEAMIEGGASLKHLNALENQLGKVTNWGTYKYQGSRRHTMYRRDAMDRARELSHHCQRALTRFERELADVSAYKPQFNVVMHRSEGFLDVLFENLMSDWIINQKVRTTLVSVKATKKDVNSILQALAEENENISLAIKDIEKEKDQIVLNS